MQWPSEKGQKYKNDIPNYYDWEDCVDPSDIYPLTRDMFDVSILRKIKWLLPIFREKNNWFDTLYS